MSEPLDGVPILAESGWGVESVLAASARRRVFAA